MFLSVLTTLLGAVTLFMGFRARREILRTRAWPTVSGKILERGVGRSIGRGRSHAPHVKYTYSVGDKAYESDQVYPYGRVGYLADEVKRLVEALPDPIPVHYDPKDPGRSYLLENPMSTIWLMFVLGGAVFVIGLLKILVALLA